jgi:hypothetical protein
MWFRKPFTLRNDLTLTGKVSHTFIVVTNFTPTYNETGIPIVFLGMDIDFKDRVETQLPQFYSRIAEVLEFGLLSYDTLKEDVLPQVSPQSHLRFSSDQADADKIVKELFQGAGGTKDIGARFRDIQVLLVRCHHILSERIAAREQLIAENPTKRAPKMPVFDDDIVKRAVRKSKQRGKQKRPKKAPKASGHNESIVRDGAPPEVPQENNAEGTDSSE